MAKKTFKSVADVQRLLFEYFPDAKPGAGLDFREESTVSDLKARGMAGEKRVKDWTLPYLAPDASLKWVRKNLPALERTEPGVVKVADVVRAMWLIVYRGPVVQLATLHKRRVKALKKTLFGEGAARAAGKALERKIGAEAAKEMMKKLLVVKSYLEAEKRAGEDEESLRSAAGRTVGEFIAARLARPFKFTRWTRWERSRK